VAVPVADGLSRRAFLGRALGTGLCLPAAAAVLDACSHSSAPARPKAKARAPEGVTVLVGFGAGNQPSQVAAQEEVARGLIAARPDLKLNFERVTSGAEAKLTRDIATGLPPQLVLPVGADGVSRFVEGGTWEDLRPRLDADGLDLDRLFVPEALAAARAAAYYGPGSQRVVGLPLAVHSRFIAVNDDLFHKARLPVPRHAWGDAAWTYDKLLDLARSTTVDAKGRRAGQPAFDPAAIVQYGLARLDTDVIARGYAAVLPWDPATRKVGYASGEFVAGLQFAADLRNRHHVVPSDAAAAALAAAAPGADPRMQLWLSGRAAMAEVCTCDLPSWGAVKGFAWSATAVPAGPRGLATALEVELGTMVAAKGARLDRAWEVLKGFLVTPANQARLASGGSAGIPALRENSHLFAEGLARSHPGLDPAIVAGGVSHGTLVGAWHPAYDALPAAVGTFVDRALAGQLPPAEAAAMAGPAAQQVVDAWLSSHRLPG